MGPNQCDTCLSRHAAFGGDQGLLGNSIGTELTHSEKPEKRYSKTAIHAAPTQDNTRSCFSLSLRRRWARQGRPDPTESTPIWNEGDDRQEGQFCSAEVRGTATK